METYKVVFLQTALDDLKEIVLYISNDSKSNAITWHNKLIELANKLSNFPLMGVIVHDKKIAKLGVRMLPIGKYVLFYKVYEPKNEVIILRNLNSTRKYSNLF